MHEVTGDSGLLLQYADDAKFLVSDKSPLDIRKKMCDILEKLDSWCSKWKLSLNLKKCKMIYFSLNNNFSSPAPIIFKDTLIENCLEIKDLGIILDSKLTFASHISYINLKLRRLLGVFFRLFYFLRDTHVIKSINITLLMS